MAPFFSDVELPAVAMSSDGGLSVVLGTHRVLEPMPVTIELTEYGERTVYQLGYAESARDETALRGFAELIVGTVTVSVLDDWVVTGTELRLSRQVKLSGTGSESAGFATGVFLHAGVGSDWRGVTPFAPGVSYGDGEPVGPGFLGGRAGRRGGVESILVREDRLAAPVFGYRGGDGRWVAVLHEHPDAVTVSADAGLEAGGETLIDERLGFASLGGSCDEKGLLLGACYPGSEGEYTYSSGGLPLTQQRQWRRRYHPLVDGAVQRYDVLFRFGASESVPDFYRQVWRWAYEQLAPAVAAVDSDEVVTACTKVLAEQVITLGDRTGVPLEADAVTADATGLETQAVMGFVGANTDAAYLLLRATDENDRATGKRMMDTFAGLDMFPPAAEGFDTITGKLATYRSIEGRSAVYARSVAEGCLAAVQAWAWERNEGRDHPHWLEWARTAGDWLVSRQAPDGASPRAWLAGSAETLDASTTASHVGVSFLVALSQATADNRYLQAAIRGAEFCWRNGGSEGSFAGGTLDNPNVIDKESAVLALEGFLDLYALTGEPEWLARAEVAGTVAESWTYLWNVPMPIDADDAALHFKRGASTIGYQLIATGVSMTDGFLAVNAAAFARLFQYTGDRHYLDFARLVTHGTKTMLALPGGSWDLRGPGWQQEHWCFAVRRGFGLNRRWLPWVPVAHVKGILRLRELPSEIAEAVLDLDPRPATPDEDSPSSAWQTVLPAGSDHASRLPNI